MHSDRVSIPERYRLLLLQLQTRERKRTLQRLHHCVNKVMTKANISPIDQQILHYLDEKLGVITLLLTTLSNRSASTVCSCWGPVQQVLCMLLLDLATDTQEEMNASLHRLHLPSPLFNFSHAGWREAFVSKPLCRHPLLPLDHWAPAMQCVLVKCPIGMHGIEHECIPPPRLVLQSTKQAQRAAACSM